MSSIEENLNLGLFGVFLYVFITDFPTVIAPISSIYLLPVTVLLWGRFYA
ncbi:MAG: hypothetical protein VX028_01060 [Nanoarchaeota archaeon]|nr:hypothetical protein [Nanoarchaeota archaeon]